ncbi:MAG: hypothetical protein SFU83_17190 [Meiothermus sp.]|nr:hypothetical protein [Meiothermus sp.]
MYRYLNQRDGEPFDTEWSRAFGELEAAKKTLSSVRQKAIEDESGVLRETVFKAVLQAAKSPDLAAYLSDDAGLIYENAVVS